MVWSSVIGTLAVPVLLIALFNSQIFVSFPFMRDDTGFEKTIRRLFFRLHHPGIVTADGAKPRGAGRAAARHDGAAGDGVGRGAAAQLRRAEHSTRRSPSPRPSPTRRPSIPTATGA